MDHFIDANIPMYASGAPSEFKEPSVRVLRAAADGRLRGYSDVMVLQEIVYRYAGLGRTTEGIAVAQRFVGGLPAILSVDLVDAVMMMAVLREGHAIPPMDALHYAVMRRQGITRIITADTHFDSLPGITRIDPRNTGEILV